MDRWTRIVRGARRIDVRGERSIASARVIAETAGVVSAMSEAMPATAEISLIVGVVEDSGVLCALRGVVPPSASCTSSVCSGAVNGTTIRTTNQRAIS